MDISQNFYIVEDKLQSACQALQAGFVIAHATETVYGLAADPWQDAAVQQIIRMKGREQSKGLLLLLPDRPALSLVVREISPLACDLMEWFWPGPLTLLLPASTAVPELVRGGGDWVAVRHSSSPLVAQLMRLWKRPLISTSANRTGEPPQVTAAGIQEIWGSEVACILPGEVAPQARPSTIVKVDGPQWHVVREGAIERQRIVHALSEVGSSRCQRVAHE